MALRRTRLTPAVALAVALLAAAPAPSGAATSPTAATQGLSLQGAPQIAEFIVGESLAIFREDDAVIRGTPVGDEFIHDRDIIDKR